MKIYLTIYLIGVLSGTCVCLVLWAIRDIKDGNGNKKRFTKHN